LSCLLDDVAAERAIERAAKEVRDQIAKGAADCKFIDFFFSVNNFLFVTFSST
jgi:hypothetical protein